MSTSRIAIPAARSFARWSVRTCRPIRHRSSELQSGLFLAKGHFSGATFRVTPMVQPHPTPIQRSSAPPVRGRQRRTLCSGSSPGTRMALLRARPRGCRARPDSPIRAQCARSKDRDRAGDIHVPFSSSSSSPKPYAACSFSMTPSKANRAALSLTSIYSSSTKPLT